METINLKKEQNKGGFFKGIGLILDRGLYPPSLFRSFWKQGGKTPRNTIDGAEYLEFEASLAVLRTKTRVTLDFIPYSRVFGRFWPLSRFSK